MQYNYKHYKIEFSNDHSFFSPNQGLYLLQRSSPYSLLPLLSSSVALLPFLSQFIWITFLIQTFSSLPHTPISTTHFLYFFYHAFISLIALSSLSISLHSFLYWSLATTTLHSPFCIDLLLQCYDFFIFLKSNPVHSCSQ